MHAAVGVSALAALPAFVICVSWAAYRPGAAVLATPGAGGEAAGAHRGSDGAAIPARAQLCTHHHCPKAAGTLATGWASAGLGPQPVKDKSELDSALVKCGSLYL